MSLVRSTLFNAWFFGCTFVLGLVGVGVRVFAPGRALGFARFWAGVVLWGARWIAGIEVTVRGLERLPAGPLLLASQHQSAFDTLIWAVLLPRFAYVYKAELARIPLFGPMLRAAGQIPLDRTASVSSVRSFLRAAQGAVAAGRQIVIFPEGTRVAPGDSAPIRAGFAMVAARTGLPVYPVATDSGRCWGRRAFSKRAGTIHITVGEPIAADVAPAALIEALRQRWKAAEGAVDKRVDEAVTGVGAGAANVVRTGDFGGAAGAQGGGSDAGTAPAAAASHRVNG